MIRRALADACRCEPFPLYAAGNTSGTTLLIDAAGSKLQSFNDATHLRFRLDAALDPLDG